MTHYTYEPLPRSTRSVVRQLAELVRASRPAGRLDGGSLNERIAVALVLDRADWLMEMDCSMLEATQHLDAVWLQACREVQRSLQRGRA